MKKDINKYWDDYRNMYSFEEVLKIYREKKALEFIHKKKPNRILEIGCGFTPIFLNYHDFDQCTIVEPGLKAFNNALEKSSANSKIECINDYFENVYEKLKINDYDFIVSTGVLHETPTPIEFLKTIQKLSNRETEVYINVPNAQSLHRVIAKEMGLINTVYERSERNIVLKQNAIFDRNSLLALVKKALPSANVKDCKSFFIKPFTHEQMMKCIDESIFDETIFEGLYKASNYYPDSGCELYCVFNILEK